MDFDTTVKLAIYETVARTARTPTAREVAAALDAAPADVVAAFQRLHGQRLLGPEPGDPSRIRMAPPFSGVETGFRVRIQDRLYHANCVWDALGIAAALHRDAHIEAFDGHTMEPMALEVKDARPVPATGVAHFAVPAARWWADVIHT